MMQRPCVRDGICGRIEAGLALIRCEVEEFPCAAREYGLRALLARVRGTERHHWLPTQRPEKGTAGSRISYWLE